MREGRFRLPAKSHRAHERNLSSHLSRLEQAGLVEIQKRFEGKQPVTYAKLTREGRKRLKEYWDQIDRIRQGTKPLKSLRVTRRSLLIPDESKV